MMIVSDYRIEIVHHERDSGFLSALFGSSLSGVGWDWRIVNGEGKVVRQHDSGYEGNYLRSERVAVSKAQQALRELATPKKVEVWKAV